MICIYFKMRKSQAENTTAQAAGMNEVIGTPTSFRKLYGSRVKSLLYLFGLGIPLTLILICGYHAVWRDQKKVWMVVAL